MDIELAQSIQRQMNRRGYTAAAEDFLHRARFYSEREMSRLSRSWLRG